jgi:hypothetical protein
MLQCLVIQPRLVVALPGTTSRVGVRCNTVRSSTSRPRSAIIELCWGRAALAAIHRQGVASLVSRRSRTRRATDVEGDLGVPLILGRWPRPSCQPHPDARVDHARDSTLRETRAESFPQSKTSYSQDANDDALKFQSCWLIFD